MINKLKQLSLFKQLGLTLVMFVAFGIIGTSVTPTHPVELSLSKYNRVQLINPNQTNRVAKKAVPVIVAKSVTQTQSVAYTSSIINDPSIPKGSTKITTGGINGTQAMIFMVTLTDGVQTSKDLISSSLTTPPVNKVTSIGTYVAPAAQSSPKSSQSNTDCDSNYSGACVPNVYPTDVDCGGGSGNGPYYVYGPLRVIGTDHYGLDRDGDGAACE